MVNWSFFYVLSIDCLSSEPSLLTCVFHGQCADSTMRDYNSQVEKEGDMLVVVMYAQLTKEGIYNLNRIFPFAFSFLLIAKSDVLHEMH